MVRVRTSDGFSYDLNLSEQIIVKITDLELLKTIKNDEIIQFIINRHNRDESAHHEIMSRKANILDLPEKISDLSDDTSLNPISKANTLTGLISTVSELNILNGISTTATELNYLSGTTSNIQTQLDSKIEASDISSKADKLYQDYVSISDGDIILQDDKSMYVHSSIDTNTTFTFDDTALTKKSTNIVTFELLLSVEEVVSLTFPLDVKWLNGDIPTIDNTGSYLFSFRTAPMWNYWIGCLEGAWS